MAETRSSSSSSLTQKFSSSSKSNKQKKFGTPITTIRNGKIDLQKNITYLIFFCIWIFLIHLGGLYLFTRGFLLTRLVLNNHSECSNPPFPNILFNNNSDNYSYPWKGTIAGQKFAHYQDNQNNHDNNEDNQDNRRNGGRYDSCWYPSNYKKAIIIIIDALRFDFTIPHNAENDNNNNNNDDSENKYYHNKLPIFDFLLRTQPENSLIFQYIADAPTTTLQRLKALTTGTLPTFIDAGSNFAGSAIMEDNMIYQLRKLGKKIAFMGDDTWISLFPKEFEPNMTNPFPSLNVWDLHTVDDGILKLFEPIFQNEGKVGKGKGKEGEDWDVLIAHFLGVDHCGHRYGPDHPAMAEKLQQMNEMINNVTKNIEEDTIVLIMGDHGMDSKGDHGGDSDNEVESALFIYSKKKLMIQDSNYLNILSRIYNKLDKSNTHGIKSFTSKYEGKWRSIPQIDFVPTLSLLLGIPIPFNNLGSLIPEVFLHNNGNDNSVEEKLLNLLNVLRLNSQQVYRYAKEYSMQQSSSADLSTEDLKIMNNMFHKAENEYKLLLKQTIEKNENSTEFLENLENLIVLYMNFLRNTLSICRRIWAQFDLSLMISGISILISSCICIGLHIIQSTKNHSTFNNYVAVRHILVGGSFGAVFARLGLIKFIINKFMIFIDSNNFTTLDIIIFGSSIGSIIGYFIEFSRFGIISLKKKKITSDNLLAIFFLILHSLLFASNSFTIHEDRISLALIQTFGIYTFIKSFRIKDHQLRKRLIVLTITFLIISRISSYSTVCREEQMPYCISTFYASISTTSSSPNVLIILVTLGVIIPFIIRRTLQLSKSYSGIAPIWIDIGLRAGLIMSAAYWVMDNGGEDSNNYSNNNYGENSNNYGENNNNNNNNIITELLMNQSWKWVKNFIVRLAFGLATIVGGIAWMTNPLCLELKMININEEGNKQENGINLSGNRRRIDIATLGTPKTSKSSKSSKSSLQSENSDTSDNSENPQPIITSDKSNSGKVIAILGYGNAFGSSYFIFLTIIYLLLVITQKPMGGIMLSIAICQILCLLEIIDTTRNVYELSNRKKMQNKISRINRINKTNKREKGGGNQRNLGDIDEYIQEIENFSSSDNSNTSGGGGNNNNLIRSTKFIYIVIISLLSTLYFFSTGHQATLSSIQWSTGFIGISEANFTITPILIILNTLASQILFTCSIPLMIFWNITPRSDYPIFYEITKTIMFYLIYQSILTTSSVIWAGIFRRHLMVWKIFVPRFLLGGISLLLVDLVIWIFVLGIGCWKVMNEVTGFFDIHYK
ncbi:hypothetical protein Glove_543g52 [Diversispora epigaea]|uniref:GPI ethanolamine phosphate transferase 2 C-terminal domain-containing protein n=1 Tax=Diversispora epigaea TaxID=1348612 RepID=A0A397GCD9_9GLOM|nr:hypothetical protein Glove_543g52 [Diversispora epigaea]